MTPGPTPWLERPEWEGGVVRLRQRHRLTAHWVGALIWNGLSLPILVAVWMEPGGWGQVPPPARLLYLAWALFGLFLLFRAVVATLRARRFQDVVLELDPFPGSIGGQAGGSVEIPVPANTDIDARASLHCIHSFLRTEGEGDPRRREVLWSREVIPEVERSGGGSRLRFAFDVPDEDLPESEPPGADDRRFWAVRIVAGLPGADLDRVFEVPVYRVDPPTRASRPFQPPEVDFFRATGGRIDARRIPGGVEIDYRRGRWGWLGPGTAAGGLFFGAVGALVWTLARGGGGASGLGIVPLLFAGFFLLVFGGIGLVLLLAGLHMMLSRRTVTVDEDVVRSRSWWLFLPSESEAPREELTSIESKVTSASGSGTDRVGSHTFVGHLAGGGTILLGDGVRGSYLAEEVARLFEEELGVPVTTGRPDR